MIISSVPVLRLRGIEKVMECLLFFLIPVLMENSLEGAGVMAQKTLD